MSESSQRQLHIAMVVRSFSTNGGLELYAHQVIEGLLDRGHHVAVICEQVESHLTHDHLSIIKFPPPPKNAPKWKRFQHQYQSASQALKQAGSFDIIHTQQQPVDGADVCTFHNQTIHQLERVGLGWERVVNFIKRNFTMAYRLHNELDALLCQQCHCLVFPSHVTRDDYLLTYGGDGTLAMKPTVIAHPGASLATATQSSLETTPVAATNPLTFLFVGRGYRKKGLDILLKACQKLNQQGQNFKLLIAGLRAKPIDQLRLKCMGLTDKVSYLGFQSDITVVYRQASVFVTPSRTESFGMAPLQAMRWGLVPIVSRVAGISEILTKDKDAFIIENHLDASELANLMKCLIDQPERLPSISKAARQVALEATWDKTVESTLEAYDLALARKAAKNR